MQNMFQRARKGVSPLIAAVLLIAFTMAVAAILTAWVTTFTQEQTEAVSNNSDQFVSCSGGVVDILGTSSSSSEVNVSVANVGNADFDNVTVVALSSGSVAGIEYISPLNQGQTDFAQVGTGGQQADTVRVSANNCPSVTDTKTNP